MGVMEGEHGDGGDEHSVCVDFRCGHDTIATWAQWMWH